MRNMKTAAFKNILVVLIAATALIQASCSGKASARSYALQGTVITVDPQHRLITIDEKAVPGYMDAMEMTYQLPDDVAVASFKPGDQIEATLKVTSDKSWLESIRVSANKNGRT